MDDELDIPEVQGTCGQCGLEWFTEEVDADGRTFYTCTCCGQEYDVSDFKPLPGMERSV